MKEESLFNQAAALSFGIGILSLLLTASGLTREQVALTGILVAVVVLTILVSVGIDRITTRLDKLIEKKESKDGQEKG